MSLKGDGLNKFMLLILLYVLISCGASDEEELVDAKTRAENYLTTSQCDEALEELNAIGFKNDDAEYLKLYASTYACLAGYDTSTFFGSDITNIDTTNVLSSFSTFSYSQGSGGSGTTAYDNLQIALDTLLYAGGIALTTNPSSTERSALFSSRDLAEINSLALYLVLNQFGAYNYFYGNTNATGVKGGGDAAESNVCFFSYNVDGGGTIDGHIDTALGASGGSCSATGQQGKNELSNGGNIDVAIACQGVVLFNNFRDLLASVALGSITDTDLSSVDTFLETAFATLSTYGISFTDSSITTVKSQTRCEADFATNYRDLQIYFAFFIELLHNKT